MAIDTACSSSLVALNSAMQSIRDGESEMAIVAGVNLMLSPKPTIQMCQAKMLTPEGHCKTFDASADGFTRGEGCGVIVLKPLSKAKEHGDRIWGLVRASAVNQDGASSGLTVPNANAQERLMKYTLSKAGLNPEDIDYIEAHGTGTSLGDPIEVRGLTQVFSQRKNKAEKPLIISSTKTYLGHTESAAGIAGLIRTILSMHYNYIPKQLHFNHQNPAVDFAPMNAIIPIEGRQWPETNCPKRATVSSFGFSGIIASAVLEETPKDYVSTVNPLPMTQFNRQHYWIETKSKIILQGEPTNHPLWQTKEDESRGNLILNGQVKLSEQHYLQDHKVFDDVVFPGAAYIDGLLLALKTFDLQNYNIQNLSIEKPLLISSQTITLQTVLEPEGQGYHASINTKAIEGEWQCHVDALIATAVNPLNLVESIADLKSKCSNEINVKSIYEQFSQAGLQYGKAFQGLKALWKNERSVFAELATDLPSKGYCVHPSLLDAALQATAGLSTEDNDKLYLPWMIESIHYNPNTDMPCYASIELVSQDESSQVANIKLLDSVGRIVLSLHKFQARAATKAQLKHLLHPQKEIYLLPTWQEIELPSASEIVEFDAANILYHYKNTDALTFATDLLEIAQSNPKKLIILTKGLYDNSNPNVGVAMGFVKTLLQENLNIDARLIDLDNEEQLQAALALNEPIVAVYKNKAFVQRLVHVEQQEQPEQEMHFSGDYLITGGLGGLGLTLARWLIAHGANRTILASRKSPNKQTQNILSEMTGNIDIVQLDVSDKTQVKKLLEEHQYTLKGIFHLAGVLDDGIVSEQTPERFKTVFSPKVNGAYNLHKAAQDLNIQLEHFVLFSSIASSMGNPGQINYAAANSYLDQLASFRKEQGLPALSINWGVWSDSGMATDLTTLHARSGINAFDAEAGMRALNYCLQQDESNIQAVDIIWNTLSKRLSKVPAWLKNIIREKSSVARGYLLTLLSQVELNQRETILKAELIRILREVMGISSSQSIDDSQSFFEMGMDSLMSMSLRNGLLQALGSEFQIPMTVVFDHSSIKELSEYILQLIIDTNLVIENKVNNEFTIDKYILTNSVSGHDSPENEFIDINVKRIFLNGVTGVLGACVLKELLLNTECTIYCLVRAKTIESAYERIIQHLSVYADSDFFKSIDLKTRIKIYLGDVTSENFGLIESAYHEICNEVDLLMHLVSDVSLFANYETLEPVNIGGLKSAVKMASQTKNKYILYVSTYAILSDFMYKDHSPFTENDFDIGQNFSEIGYVKTKFEAEQIVRESKKDGIKWIIVRPGNIMGDSERGAYPLLINKKPSLFYDMLKLFYTTSCAPMLANYYDMTPVDYVAKSIVCLSCKHRYVYQVYHLTNPNFIRSYEIVHLLHEIYPHIQIMNNKQYYSRIHHDNLFKGAEIQSSLQFNQFKSQPMTLFSEESTYASSVYTQNILLKYGISCPEINVGYLRQIMDYALKCGYIVPFR